MAGAGYKLFNTGDVLLASEVNTYLQQQVTMVFANAAARTTALSGVLAEGMMSYLQDTNTVEVYNGTSWVNVGNAGDITEVQAGTGISVASGTGPIPVVTNTVATTFDAKGDLIVGTGADTFAKLTVGTNGHTLVADSAEATGLKWAAPAGGGKVLQVVYAEYSTATIVASTTFTDTGLTASITPSATNSKILVIVSQQHYSYRANTEAGHSVKLLRGATDIFTHGGTGNYGSGFTYVAAATGVGIAGTASFEYLDSPNTTSSTTYKTQGRSYLTSNSGQVTYQDFSSKSTITLLEIGA